MTGLCPGRRCRQAPPLLASGSAKHRLDPLTKRAKGVCSKLSEKSNHHKPAEAQPPLRWAGRWLWVYSSALSYSGLCARPLLGDRIILVLLHIHPLCRKYRKCRKPDSVSRSRL